MQCYHLDSKGIPEYINKLRDAQAKAKRENNLITNLTLVIIATNAMLSTEQFTRANKDWEKLDVVQSTWARWKNTYRAAAKNAAIKKKTASGKDQFGDTHSATPPMLAPVPMGGETEVNNTHMGLAVLDGYFVNIAAAVTKKNSVLEELVTKLTTLTIRNKDISSTIKKLADENQQLHQKLYILKNCRKKNAVLVNTNQ